MCIVYTSRIAYCGLDRLDTTVKLGKGLGKLLAPTWELVGGIKHHETAGHDTRWVKYASITREQYIEGYYELMRTRYKTYPEAFVELIQGGRWVICCYCAAGEFCHRHLIVDILERIAQSKNLPFVRGGELAVR